MDYYPATFYGPFHHTKKCDRTRPVILWPARHQPLDQVEWFTVTRKLPWPSSAFYLHSKPKRSPAQFRHLFFCVVSLLLPSLAIYKVYCSIIPSVSSSDVGFYGGTKESVINLRRSKWEGGRRKRAQDDVTLLHFQPVKNSQADDKPPLEQNTHAPSSFCSTTDGSFLCFASFAAAAEEITQATAPHSCFCTDC